MVKEVKQETESLSSVTSIQLGNMKVEYLKPDYALVYSTLTAHVAAAHAFASVDEYEFAKKSLRSAMDVIELFSKRSGLVFAEDIFSLDK